MATQTTNYGLKKPSYSDTADIGVINSNMDIIDAKMKEIDNKITNETDPTVPAWAKEPNKPTYTAEEVGALPNNTPIPDPTSVVVDRLVSVGTHIADISVNGEKTELYAPTGGGGTSVTIDSELSTTSENPVQNKVITQALNGKGTYSKPTGGIPKTDLANEVQTSLGKADTALQEHQDISGKADKTEVTALFNSISDAWDSATAYTVGQYCIYNNAIWKCLVANTNTEPTEGTHWTQTTIDAEISAVNSSLTAENNQSFRYGYQNNKYGYWIKEADTDVFVPFKNYPPLIGVSIYYQNTDGLGESFAIFDVTDFHSVTFTCTGGNSGYFQICINDKKLTYTSGTHTVDLTNASTFSIGQYTYSPGKFYECNISSMEFT